MAHEERHLGKTTLATPKQVKPKKTMTCSICDKLFKSSQSLEGHRITQHTLEKSHKCAICLKLFSLEDARNRHEKDHNKIKQVIRCSICNKQYSSWPGLNYHKKSFHEGNTRNCQQCDKKFKTPESLSAHMNVHTDAQRQMYACDVCGDQFTTKGYIKIHKEAQHQQVTHECQKCGKEFKYKNQIKLHMETHNEGGNQFFECTICGEKFSTSGYMKLHKKSVHFGIIHQCLECPMKFRWKITLTKHIRENHRCI